MQNLDFHQSLDCVFLFVLNNFDSVFSIRFQVDTSDNLAKSALSYVFDNFVSNIFWGNNDLILAKDILTSSSYLNFLSLLIWVTAGNRLRLKVGILWCILLASSGSRTHIIDKILSSGIILNLI